MNAHGRLSTQRRPSEPAWRMLLKFSMQRSKMLRGWSSLIYLAQDLLGSFHAFLGGAFENFLTLVEKFVWKLVWLRLVEKFCDASCMIQLVPDINNAPSSEKFCRRSAAEWQACSVLCWAATAYSTIWLCLFKHCQSAVLSNVARLRWMISIMWLWLILPSLAASGNKTSTNMHSGCRTFSPRTPSVPKLQYLGRVAFKMSATFALTFAAHCRIQPHCKTSASGAIGVVICPLLTGTAAGASLRQDQRTEWFCLLLALADCLSSGSRKSFGWLQSVKWRKEDRR